MQGMNDFTPQVPLEETWTVKQERRRFNRVGLALFALMAISFFAVQGGAALYMRIATEMNNGIRPETPAWFAVVFTVVSLYVVAAPIAYLLFRTTPAEAPERRRLNVKGFLFFTCIGFLFIVAGGFIGNIVNTILSLILGVQQGGDVAEAMTSGDLWLNIVYSCIMAPILEELFFRKLLIDRLRGAGDVLVMLTSGITFGLFHGNIEQFFYAALMGMLFAYIYLYTGNILYCIGIHSIMNIVCGMVPMLLMMLGDSVTAGMAEGPVTDLIWTFFALIGVAPQYLFAVVGLVILIVYFASLKRQLRAGRLTFGEAGGAAFGNVGMVLFIMMCLFEIVLSILLSLLPSA